MMRNTIILLFMSFVFISCSGCNSSHSSPPTDSDTDSSPLTDSDIDSPLTDSDIDSPLIDHDSLFTDSDTDTKEYPDMVNNPYTHYYPNYDKNIAYKYYGDYDVISKDPENVRALWEKKAGISTYLECEPAAYDLCSENYSFEPQIINGKGSYTGLKPEVFEQYPAGRFQCDALLNPGYWRADEISQQVTMSELNGKLMYLIFNSTGSWQTGAVYTYDFGKKQIIRYSRGLLTMWQNEKYLFMMANDYRIDSQNKESIYYGTLVYHPIYYDKKEHSYGYAWKMKTLPLINGSTDLRASETHLFMTAYFSPDYSGNDARLMYTKIGEWDKWKELTYKKTTLYGLERRAGFPDMIGQYVTYFDYDLQVQFCDLEKGDAGCFKVSREGEYGRRPHFYKGKNTIIYSAQNISNNSLFTIVEANITDPQNITYKELTSSEKYLSMGVYDLDDEFLLIKARKPLPDDPDRDEIGIYCYYRFKDGKEFCLDSGVDMELTKSYGYIYKRQLVFQSSFALVVRDMECYCDFYPDKCPFDDYTPNTAHPKEPWKR